MIMEKKVKIIAFYVSFTGAMKQKEWEVDTVGDAKAFIEKETDELTRPIYGISSTTKEEEGMEYDVTVLTKYWYSSATIIDYSDGRKLEEKTNNNNNQNKEE